MEDHNEKKELYLKHIYVYRNDVYRIVRSVIGDHDVAEDITQTVLTNAWRSFHTLKDLNKSKAWVKAITRNEIRQYMKKKQKQDLSGVFADPAEVISRAELQGMEKDILLAIEHFEEIEVIGTALRSLDKEYQILIRERLFEECTLKEISRRHNLKYKWVLKHYAIGIKRLVEVYEILQEGGAFYEEQEY